MTDELDALAAQITALWRDFKAQRCAHVGGPVDLMPQLHCVTVADEHTIAVFDAEREFLPAAIGQLVARTGSLKIVVWQADAHFQVLARDEPEPERGDLRDAFAAGDLAVRDALVTCAVDAASSESRMSFAPYHYDDAGQVVFDDDEFAQELHGSEFSSTVVELIQEGLAEHNHAATG